MVSVLRGEKITPTHIHVNVQIHPLSAFRHVWAFGSLGNACATSALARIKLPLEW